MSAQSYIPQAQALEQEAMTFYKALDAVNQAINQAKLENLQSFRNLATQKVQAATPVWRRIVDLLDLINPVLAQSAQLNEIALSLYGAIGAITELQSSIAEKFNLPEAAIFASCFGPNSDCPLALAESLKASERAAASEIALS